MGSSGSWLVAYVPGSADACDIALVRASAAAVAVLKVEELPAATSLAFLGPKLGTEESPGNILEFWPVLIDRSPDLS